MNQSLKNYFKYKSGMSIPEIKSLKPEKKEESKGLGDTIEKFTKATGIKKVVDKVTGGGGCGCNKRKETLNNMFPYKNN